MKQALSDNPLCRIQARGCLAVALLIAASLGLGGCGSGGGGGGSGGGGGGGGSSVSTSTPDLPPPDNDGGLVGVPGSTLLDENSLTGSTSFDNFSNIGLQLTVAQILASEQVTFVGDDTFLKLARSDGEVLFLGSVNRNQSLDLLVDLPLDTRLVRYEIFSGSPLDNTLFGEISI